jgi:hypothetical protein
MKAKASESKYLVVVLFTNGTVIAYPARDAEEVEHIAGILEPQARTERIDILTWRPRDAAWRS